MTRSVLAPLLLSGCWVLTDDELAAHDRKLADPESPPHSPIGTDTPTTDSTVIVDTAAPDPIPCGEVRFTRAGVAFTGGWSAAAIAAGDFDGDDDVDLAMSNFSDASVTWARNEGDGTFGAPETLELPMEPGQEFPSPGPLAVHDFTGDGVDDLAVVDAANPIVWVLEAATGTLTLGTSLEGSPWPNAATVAHLDGDTVPDLAVAALSGAIDQHFGEAGGGFRDLATFGIGGTPGHVAAGDLDGDGQVDLAISDQTADALRIWRGLGDGTFAPAEAFPRSAT